MPQPQHALDVDGSVQQRIPPITPRPAQRLKQEHADSQPSQSTAQAQNTEANAKSPTAERDPKPPPAKRSRKAINCEPCRSSKLKCDRSVLKPSSHANTF